MRKFIRLFLIVGVGIIFILGIVFVVIPFAKTGFEITPIASLPSSDHLAYKIVGRTNGGYMAYRVYTIEGWVYNVSESDWGIIRVPALIGPNLYRMPDGTYVMGVIK